MVKKYFLASLDFRHNFGGPTKIDGSIATLANADNSSIAGYIIMIGYRT